MEGFSFVTPVTGLSIPDTGREDDDDDDDEFHSFEICSDRVSKDLSQNV
jgi:hypothetical protein